MAGIGDYIHLYYRNYAAEGIQNDVGQNSGEAGIAEAYEVFRKQREDFLSNSTNISVQLNSTESAEIRKNLSKIIKKQSEIQDTNGQVLLKSILDEIHKKSLEHLSKGKNEWINFQTGDLDESMFDTAEQSILSKSFTIFNDKNRFSNKESISLNSLQKAVDKIFDEEGEIIQYLNSLTKKPGAIMGLKKRIINMKNLYNQLNEINEEGTSALQRMSSNSRLYLDKKRFSATDQDWEKIKKFRDGMRRIVDDLQVKPYINQILRGDILEYALAISLLQSAKISQDEIKKILSSKNNTVVMGGSREPVTIKFDNFTSDVNWSQFNRRIGEKQTDGEWKIASTQGKIDVSFEYNMKKINFSAKNVNLQSNNNIHVLSGSSLLFLIQDLNSVFVNHFLNNISDNLFDIDNPYAVKKRILSEQAKFAMSLILIWKGLTGQNEGRNVANYFIINDNKSTAENSIYIYSMNELYERIVGKKGEKMLSNGQIIINNALPFMKFSVDNTKASSYSERITKILQQLHQAKITVSFSPQIII